MKYQLFLGKVLSPKKFTTFGKQNNICAARNMVANESARMAFDYLKPSNIFSKKVHDSNHWKLLIFQMPSQLQKLKNLWEFVFKKTIRPTSLQRSKSP